MSGPGELDPATTSVSVVIPSYRHPDRLRSCLAALATQDHPGEQLEVVVVDDGSPEPLAVVEADFRGRLRLHVHRQDNAGPAVARNVGAEIATGTLLAFTDDDCAPAPGWVGELARAHAERPAALLGGEIVNAVADQACAEASQLLVSFLYDWFPDDSPSRFFASNNLAVSRAAFLASGGFDTTFPRPGGEDRELCERWQRDGGILRHAPAAVVHHHHRMSLPSFCRQHMNYGRGAYDVHRRRVAAGEPRVRIEPLRFYLGLLRYPFGRATPRRAVGLSALLGVSQAANAVGFFVELQHQRSSLTRR